MVTGPIGDFAILGTTDRAKLAVVSTADRDARLDALVTATQQWADKRIKQFTNQVALSKALLKGRTGSERLARANVRAGSKLVTNAIDDFLQT